MFVYYNAVIESKQMFAAMQEVMIMNETRKKSYRRTRAKRVKRYTYLSILFICTLPRWDHLQQADCGGLTRRKPRNPINTIQKYGSSVGDTLWDIANNIWIPAFYRSLDDYMDEIREINSINYKPHL